MEKPSQPSVLLCRSQELLFTVRRDAELLPFEWLNLPIKVLGQTLEPNRGAWFQLETSLPSDNDVRTSLHLEATSAKPTCVTLHLFSNSKALDAE